MGANRPFQDIIKRYDRPHTFYFIDPSYYGIEDYYGKDIFSRNDYLKLSRLEAKMDRIEQAMRLINELAVPLHKGLGKMVLKECAAVLEKLGLHMGALEREE